MNGTNKKYKDIRKKSSSKELKFKYQNTIFFASILDPLSTKYFATSEYPFMLAAMRAVQPKRIWHIVDCYPLSFRSLSAYMYGFVKIYFRDVGKYKCRSESIFLPAWAAALISAPCSKSNFVKSIRPEAIISAEKPSLDASLTFAPALINTFATSGNP